MPWRAEPYVLLEDRLTRGARARLYHRPLAILQCDEPAGLLGVLGAVEDGLSRGLHAAGFFYYESMAAFEARASVQPSPDPIAWFGLFERIEHLPAEDLDAAFAELGPPCPIRSQSPGHDRDRHVARVRKAKALIGSGDIYQVNLTYPIDFCYDGEPEKLYGALRAAEPVAHGALARLEDRAILSVSPELFLRREGAHLVTRPMKGTAARGSCAAEDPRAAAGLQADPKQRAENLMITDLLRNDLSRVCVPGSVTTPALFSVETYPSFHALTSTVTGRLRENVPLRETLAALFPCGSIVGAPKIRAAQVIAELETRGRGVYTGAIGAIAPNGDFEFNVAIRTAVLMADGRGRYGVGGGIVADSDPAAEFAETELKARVLTDLAQDHQLIETLRWSSQEGFVRLDAHLSRLAGSAATLGFRLDVEDLRRRLDREARVWSTSPDRRVRILLHRSGETDISSQAIAHETDFAGPWRVGISAHRLDAGDPFLRHKTTRRRHHDLAAQEASAIGLDEALLLNQYGRLADGARTSVFIRKDGLLLTPPLRDGALPGVLRQALIQNGQAGEAPISAEDLASCEILLGNSLRGLLHASLVSAPQSQEPGDR